MPQLRRLVLVAGLACGVMAIGFQPSSSFAQAAKRNVDDMRYGVALYHYYQGDYMQALTELLIAKERGGIQGYGDNPEIMEGGFSLGFGLERHASEIFERLLSTNRSRESQDAAWFFLSKLRYLRADYPGAREALSRVRDKPNEDIRDEVYAHRINLTIREEKLDEAKRLMRRRRPGGDWMPYLYFNLASAYARNQNFDQAVEYFEKLADEKYPTDELRALYDKAMTAAGYTYMMREEYAKARSFFARVRLDSPMSSSALLGYGWAAANLEAYKEALRPWQHLAKSSLVDENSQEALIAVPFAYEKLGAEALALENFQKAETLFLEERSRLQGVIDGLEGSQLLEALKIERSSGLDWLKHVRENQVSPQLGYLAELFSREEFQGVVQELRDLVGIRSDFLNWQEKLQFYRELIAEREISRSRKAEELAADQMADTIKEMRAARTRLASTIERIAAEKDFFALANTDEKDLIERAQRAQRYVVALKDSDPFIDENEEAVRRYYGMLLWNASEQFSDRLWRAVKTLNLLDKTLATVNRNYEKVGFLIENPQDLDPFKSRMVALQDRLDITGAEIDLMIDKTQDDLRRQAYQILLIQRERLNHYIAQSRLSTARLLDKALYESQQVELPVDDTDAETETDSQIEPESRPAPEANETPAQEAEVPAEDAEPVEASP